MCASMADIQSATAEIRQGKKEEKRRNHRIKLVAMLRWFTAGGAIRIAVRQPSQTWKLHHYDVIDDVITRKL